MPSGDLIEGTPGLSKVLHGDAEMRTAVAVAPQGLDGSPGDDGIDPVERDPDVEIVGDGLDPEHLPRDSLGYRLLRAGLDVPAQRHDAGMGRDDR